MMKVNSVVIKNTERELMLQGAPIRWESVYDITIVKDFDGEVEEQAEKIALDGSFGGNYAYEGDEGEWVITKESTHEYTTFAAFEDAGYFDELENLVIRKAGKKW